MKLEFQWQDHAEEGWQDYMWCLNPAHGDINENANSVFEKAAAEEQAALNTLKTLIGDQGIMTFRMVDSLGTVIREVELSATS